MRRAILAVALATAAAGGIYWFTRARDTHRAPDGPIVLISIDTLRADRLPLYGYTAIRTPNIDSLAADGVVFDRAWAHSPLTLPSHASILSGTLPLDHGVRDNIGFTVKPDQRFLQHELRDRGYATGGFVSSYVLRRQTGIHQGFDLYDDTLPPASAESPLGQIQRPGAQTVEAAVRWIDRQTSPKFFAFVHIYEPHLPYTPPAKFAAGHPYDGEVAHADEIIGGLLAHLRAKNLYDNATIVLLSDHGEGLGEHGEDEHGIFLYREMTQVPLVVKLPGSKRAGTRVAAPVQHVDVVPTVLALAAGAKPAAAAAGRSLMPAIDGSGPLPSARIYSESLSPRYHFGWSELYALSDERYRFIRAPREELYDLDQDPREQRSIAAERPQVRDAMRGALEQMLANRGPAAPSAVSDADRSRLAALGYVGTQRSDLRAAGGQLPDPKDKIDVLRRYRRATRSAGEGRIGEAIADFRALVESEPAMTDVWLQLAALHERRGAHAEAFAAYQAVIRQDPKDAAALTGAASALVRLGRLDDARRHAELAVDVSPAGANEMLARIAVNAGDAEAARRHARLAADADPSLPMPAIVEGILQYRAGDFPAAASSLAAAQRAMRERTEQLPDVNFYLGDALARMERYAEAEPFLLREVALFPQSVRARAALAMLYRAMGRADASDRAIADLIRVTPTPEGFNTAAQLWNMFGQPGRAAEMRTRAKAQAR